MADSSMFTSTRAPTPVRSRCTRAEEMPAIQNMLKLADQPRKPMARPAAIQPMVPQRRTGPKSFWASLMFAKAMLFVTEIVGT